MSRVCGPDRQLRRYPRRLLCQAARSAGQAPRGGFRQEQRAVRLPDHRYLQPPAPVLPDHLPLDGHPHLLQPGAHAVLLVRGRHPSDLHADERPQQVGTYEIPEELLAKIRQIFGTGWADEDQVRESIKHCWDENHYVIDPHTACGHVNSFVWFMDCWPETNCTPAYRWIHQLKILTSRTYVLLES